jgi:hypothetical protein
MRRVTNGQSGAGNQEVYDCSTFKEVEDELRSLDHLDLFEHPGKNYWRRRRLTATQSGSCRNLNKSATIIN